MNSLKDISSIIFNNIKSFKDSNTNILNNKNVELEVRLLMPMTYEIGKLAARLLDVKRECIEINNFIEIISKDKSNENVKYRLRKPYERMKTMHMTPNVLVNHINESRYERKTNIYKKQLFEKILSLNVNLEEQVIYKLDINDDIIINFVSQVLCRIGHWLIDYKVKNYMKISEKHLSSYLLSSYRKPTTYLEIEYNGLLSNMTDDHLMEFDTLIFNQLLLTKVSLDHIYINITKILFDPIKNIKFDTMIMQQTELLKNIDKLHYYITPKANGTGGFFLFKDNQLFITNNNTEFWTRYDTPINDTIYGRCEIIDNKIYPFFAYNPNILNLSTSSRLDHLNNLFKIMSNHSEGVMFIKKEILGPFNTREERCAGIIKLINTTEYPIDGVIYIDGNQIIDVNGCNIVDYKFKDDNTIDILGVVMMNDTAFIGKPGINNNDSTRNLTITLFGKDGDQIKNIGTSVISKNDTLFYFSVETKYFISVFQDTKILHFHKFILECSIEGDNYIVRNIRPDKTNKYYNYSYMGNPISIIKELKIIQLGKVELSIIEMLADKFDESLLQRSDDNITAISDNLKVVKIINENQNYIEDISSNVLNILIQYVKSNLIYTSCSTMFSEFYPPHRPIKNVILIDGGSGTDVRKYHSNGASYYLITDPSSEQLDKVEKLFSLTQSRISQTQKGSIGSYNVKQTTILTDNFVSICKQLMPKIDVIDWQLSIQYSWSESSKEKILNNLLNISSYGTKLLITCVDGDKLLEKLQLKNNYTINVSLDTNIQYDYIDNIKYKYKSNDKSIEEFYVSKSNLISSLEKRGFKLISCNVFKHMIDLSADFFDILYTLENQDSTKRFFTLIKSTKINPIIYNNVLDYLNMFNYYFFIRLTK